MKLVSINSLPTNDLFFPYRVPYFYQYCKPAHGTKRHTNAHKRQHFPVTCTISAPSVMQAGSSPRQRDRFESWVIANNQIPATYYFSYYFSFSYPTLPPGSNQRHCSQRCKSLTTISVLVCFRPTGRENLRANWQLNDLILAQITRSWP